MKKTYIAPTQTIVTVSMDKHLLAGSTKTGNISDVTIGGDGSGITDGSQFGSRGNSVWDDDEY